MLALFNAVLRPLNLPSGTEKALDLSRLLLLLLLFIFFLLLLLQMKILKVSAVTSLSLSVV